MNKGKLIVFEGISGSGKDTQAELLIEKLYAKHIHASIVNHPTISLKPVMSAWKKGRSIDSISEILLLLSDRHERVIHAILPALSRGEWIISLRSTISAYVYQGITDDSIQLIRTLEHRIEPKHDMVFYFDITPQEALERISKRHIETGEPFGSYETIEHLTCCKKVFDHIFKIKKHIRINAAQSEQKVLKDILANLPLVATKNKNKKT
jgi:dTMP kinase